MIVCVTIVSAAKGETEMKKIQIRTFLAALTGLCALSVASVTGTVSFLKYPLLFMIALLLWVSGVLTMHRSLLKGTVLMTGSVILIGLTDMLCWPFASIQLQMISWAMMSSYALYILLIFTAVKRLD